MKPRTMILLVVAIGCGLAASYMTSRLIAERSNEASQEAKVRVLVAKNRIPPWALVKKPEDIVVFAELPAATAPKKALKDFAQLKDKRINKQMGEGIPLTEDDIVNKDQDGLPSMLPTGYRAVAIRVSPESLAGGFVLPGTRVDILATTREGITRTRTILQDMLVLAVDMQSTRDPEKGNAMLGNTVTIAAKPDEAQRLALGANIADLRLSLRPIGEEGKPKMKETTVIDLARSQETTPEDDELNGGTSSEGSKPSIPELPSLPTTGTLPPLSNNPPVVSNQPTAPVVEEEPEEQHVMKLTIGENVQKVTFLRKPRAKEWDSDARESEPRAKPTPPAAQAPAATPAPAPEKKTESEGNSKKAKDSKNEPNVPMPSRTEEGTRTDG